MLCKAFGFRENLDMHSLKQVYLYVVCVELYCLNQVQKFGLDLNFEENPEFSVFKSYPENSFQNLSTFWG